MAAERPSRLEFSWRPQDRRAILLLLLAGAAGLAILASRGWVESGVDVPPDDSRVESAARKIDPNTADEASLRRLPQVGEVTAAAILQRRRAAANSSSQPAFQSARDLAAVPRLGPATVAQFEPYLAFPASAPADPASRPR